MHRAGGKLRITLTTDMPASRQSDKAALPWDLTEWIETKQLREWIVEVVESLDWSNPELVEYLRTHPAYRPKLMLKLLVLAYACGIFESEEIVRRCYQDELFRSICANAPPTPAAVARFRRENRGLLKGCLLQLFKRAFKTKFALGDTMLPAGVRRYLEEAAGTRLDVARQMDRGASGF